MTDPRSQAERDAEEFANIKCNCQYNNPRQEYSYSEHWLCDEHESPVKAHLAGACKLAEWLKANPDKTPEQYFEGEK